MPQRTTRLIVIWLVFGLLLIGLPVGASGCILDNVAAGTRLRDGVEQLNEGTRWGRFDIAYERVDPAYRETFGAQHRRWGQSIEIADYELLGARLAKDEQSATSTIAVSWYSYETMTVHQTTIRQKWRNTGEGYFMLDQERVTGGDERLLLPPDDELEDPDGEEAHASTSGGERTTVVGRRAQPRPMDEEDDDFEDDEMDGEGVRMGELAHQ